MSKINEKLVYAKKYIDKGMSTTQVVEKMYTKFGGSKAYYRTLLYNHFPASQRRPSDDDLRGVRL